MVRNPAITFACRSMSSLRLSTFAVMRMESPIIVAMRSGGTSCRAVTWILPPAESVSDRFCWCNFCLCSFLRSSSKEIDRTRGLFWLFFVAIFCLASTIFPPCVFRLFLGPWFVTLLVWDRFVRKSPVLFGFFSPPVPTPTFLPLCNVLPFRLFLLYMLKLATPQPVRWYFDDSVLQNTREENAQGI